MNFLSMEDKQARSVFVGNIPHGTTEEQMKDIFSVVGQVVSFRIVYDRETGNPKGYGFAEYQDADTAQSAIRNLNGFEFGGRTLRVDKASSQADELRMIHQQAGGPPVENYYGEPVPPERAPEVISRAVASLPPEQMFELMKQLKFCIQNNPSEARNMLLQNPQLAYALLQAQVVMRIVEPQVAVTLLHRQPEKIQPLMPPRVAAPRPPAFVPPVPPVPSPSNLIQPQHRPAHPPLFMQPFPGVPPRVVPPPALTTQVDQEKAALIMQVLQLNDSQIAMLPPEQRQSILILKDQIVKSTTPTQI